MHVIVADQTVGGLAGLSETAFSLMGGRVLLKWKDRREVPDMLGLPADELEHLRKGEGYLQADSGVNPIRFRGRFIAFGDIPNHEAQVRSRLDSPQRPLMSYDSTKRPIFDWVEDERCAPGFVALGKAPNFENPVFGFKVRNSKRENLFVLDKVQTMGHEIAVKFAWDLWRATGARTIVLGSPHRSEEKSVWDTISSRGANVEFAVTVEDICQTLEQADNFENTTLVFDHFLDSIEDYQELPARQTETEDKTPQTSGRSILSGLSATTMNLFAELGMDAPTSPQGSSCQPDNAEEQATWDIRPAVFELLQKGGQRDVHICFIEESTPSLFKAFGDCGATYSDDIPTLFKHRIATQCARDESMVLNMGAAASSIQPNLDVYPLSNERLIDMARMQPKVAIEPEQCASLEREYLQAMAGLSAEIQKLIQAQTELFTDYESRVAEMAVQVIDQAVSQAQIALANTDSVVQSIDEYRKFVEERSAKGATRAN